MILIFSTENSSQHISLNWIRLQETYPKHRSTILKAHWILHWMEPCSSVSSVSVTVNLPYLTSNGLVQLSRSLTKRHTLSFMDPDARGSALSSLQFLKNKCTEMTLTAPHNWDTDFGILYVLVINTYRKRTIIQIHAIFQGWWSLACILSLEPNKSTI